MFLYPRAKTIGRNVCLWELLWVFSAVAICSAQDETPIARNSLQLLENPDSCPHRRLADLNPSSPNYFNQLRLEATEVQGPENINASSVFKVNVPNSDQVYRLVELKAFIAFSINGKKPFTSPSEALTALLAVYHFNNIEKSPILNEGDVSACKDLKLTMTLLDSQSDAIATTRTFTRMLRTPKTFKSKPAAGIIGAYRSAVSLPLAILTGVNNITQISPASTARDFDYKTQFPLFGRTICNSVGEAQVAVDFFRSINSTHVAVLYVTDAYGSSLQKSFQDEASRAKLITSQIPISYDVKAGSAEIVRCVQLLKKCKFRHVYAIILPEMLRIFLPEAIKQEAVGPGYFYLLPAVGSDDLDVIAAGADAETLNALNGLGLINGVGGIEDMRTLAKLSPSPTMSSTFDKFYESWTSAVEDPAFVNFTEESLPKTLASVPGYNKPPAQFEESLGVYSLFLYDAVTAMALSMCRAPNDFFSGEEVFKEFLELEFYGVSGRIKVDNYTGTRDYETLNWAVWNSRYNGTQPDGNASFTATPAFHFVNSHWMPIQGYPFIYADGSTVPPNSLPPANIVPNYIGTTGRVVGYTLMGITMISAILSVLWFCYCRNEHIVLSAQPLFLLLVSVGTFIMASTIIPLGFEELVIDDENALSKACMSIPWLYILGVTFTLSALVAKLRGVYKAYQNPEIDLIELSDFDILKAFGALLLFNVIVLVCWTAIAPRQWTRQFGTQVDDFDRVVDTYGRCKGYNSEVFVSILAAVNLGLLVLCNWWAYRSRNIETEFNESTYIGVSVAAVLQAWCMGIPIIIVVFDSPAALFYVTTGIVFVTSQAVLSLIYLPKVLALRRHLKAGASNKNEPSFTPSNIKKSHSEGQGASCHSAMDSNVMVHSTEDDGKNPQDPVDDVDPLSMSSSRLPVTDDEHHHSVSFSLDNGHDTMFRASQGSQQQQSEDSQLSHSSQESPRSRRKSSRGHGWSLRGSGAGTKIIHNPRSQRTLALTGGYEVSRQQLENIIHLDAEGFLSGDSSALALPHHHHETSESQNPSANGDLPHHQVMQILEEEEQEQE